MALLSVTEDRMHDRNDYFEQSGSYFLLLKIMYNVGVVKNAPVCLGPAVQLCGMAGISSSASASASSSSHSALHTPAAQLPTLRPNVFSL